MSNFFPIICNRNWFFMKTKKKFDQWMMKIKNKCKPDDLLLLLLHAHTHIHRTKLNSTLTNTYFLKCKKQIFFIITNWQWIMNNSFYWHFNVWERFFFVLFHSIDLLRIVSSATLFLFYIITSLSKNHIIIHENSVCCFFSSVCACVRCVVFVLLLCFYIVKMIINCYIHWKKTQTIISLWIRNIFCFF